MLSTGPRPESAFSYLGSAIAHLGITPLFLDHTSTQNKNTSRSAASNLTEAPTNRKIVISGGKMTPKIGVRHTTETKV